MRPLAISAGLLSFLLSACAGYSNPTAPEHSLEASQLRGGAASAKSVSRPIQGGCTLEFTPPPFPLPPVFHQIDQGTCNISHLGKTTFYGEQDINFALGTQSGWRTFTAANGDELRGTHVGTSAPVGPGLIGFSATMTIVGGTGRFEDATGQFTVSGVANLATRTTTMSITDGSITY